MRLSPSEALKARLATVARESSDLAERLIKTWDCVATRFEDAGLPFRAMDDYLRIVWSANNGFYPRNNLAKISEKLNNADKLADFVDEIEAYHRSYLAIVSPSDLYLKSHLVKDLESLRTLNSQSHVFLTAVHRHHNDRFEEAVGLVVSLQIRNITVGTERPSDYEKDWPNWAILVGNGKIDSAFNEIRNKMVSDGEFQRAFEKAEISAATTAAHLLRRLDPITKSGSGVLPYEVHVEHIFPKSVASKLKADKKLTPNVRQWLENIGRPIPATAPERRQLGEALEHYQNRIGNQTLLNETANRVAKDKPFDDKKPFYEKQALELTKSLVDCEQWNLDAIKERQKKLAARAPEVWPK